MTLTCCGGEGRSLATSGIGTPGSGEFVGDLSILDLKTEYRSLKEDPARAFYRQCLLHSNSYKRAAGYFRSSVFIVIGPALIEFTRRGGTTRLLCSPELDPDDIDAVATGYARRNEWVAERLIAEIDSLLADNETTYPARVLATLVAIGALEIKLAVRSDRKGLYHEKIGVFSDGSGNRVSFKGSANETWSAWHRQGNFESIEVFCSWRGGLEAERVRKHEAHFDALWSERDPDVEAKMNKAATVTFWIDPADSQILQYHAVNTEMEFLPGRALMRLEGVEATMQMAQPFPDVWLPGTITVAFNGTTALGDFDAQYDIAYYDYRLAEVTTRVR